MKISITTGQVKQISRMYITNLLKREIRNFCIYNQPWHGHHSQDGAIEKRNKTLYHDGGNLKIVCNLIFRIVNFFMYKMFTCLNTSL
jgi:hypothetical protein